MIHRILVAASLFLTCSAFAGWMPSFSERYVELRATETRVIELRAVWSGFNPDFSFSPWVMASDREDVAHVEGGLTQLGTVGEVTITGIAPGSAWIRLVWSNGQLEEGRLVEIRVTEAPVTVSIAPSALTTTVGNPLRLTAISTAGRVTFTWYHGPRGDRSRPLLGTGNELIVTPTEAGRHTFWVSALASHGMSSDEVTIEVNAPPRRRAVGRR
jgi:hypothetical protein